MKIENYKKFIKTTAIYPKDIEVEYLVLGLFGEAGELCNLYKKVLRDNLSKEGWVIKFKKELGDFFWYLYSLENCGYLKAKIIDDSSYSRNQLSIEDSLIDLSITLSVIMKDINSERCYAKEQNRKVSYIKTVPDTLDFSGFVYNIIENQLNSSIEEILQINVDKLSSRKERGVLGGSGDNR
jgi:NTP pyrophosphatase (non-canonical NTP hydrolase)